MFDPRNLQPTELLALTIWGEARGEPIEGQLAVANVIKNRVSSDGGDYYDVILKPKQFSCWNQDDPNYPKLVEMGNDILRYGNFIMRNNLNFMQCYTVANLTRLGLVVDNTKGAKNYITNKLFASSDRPHWAQNVKNWQIVGNHTFFNA